MKKLSDVKDELLDALKPFRSAFMTVGVFSFFINLMMLAPSLYMLQVYDRVLASRNETTLLALSLLIVGLYALNALLEAIRSFVLVRVSAKLEGDPVSLHLSADGKLAFASAEEMDLVYRLSVPDLKIVGSFRMPKGSAPDPVLEKPGR